VVLAALAATCAGGPALVGPSRHVRSAITRLAGGKTGTARAAGALRATTPGRSACTVTTVLSSWPLTRLAAQTIVVPAHEGDVAAVAPEAREAFGGVILFGSSAPADLGSGLAALRRVVPYHLGLLVMTDEEGGGIQRMANLVGNMPWPSQMGATMTPGQIRALTRSIGSKMSRAGVNVDLAPVLDVDGRAVFPGKTDPDGFRSFSGTTSVVSADGVAYLRGLMQGQVLPVAKHFPGLGGASGNTDDGPASTLPWATLQRVALPPFEAAIKAGVPAIMVSNARVPGLTRVPASLSYEVVTRQLRDGLGFKGLIVTDSLSVPSISALGLSVPQAAVEALEAGDDMILYNPTRTASRDLALANGIDRAIVAAVDAKRLSKAALVAAAAQVLAAKKLDACSQAASSDRAASRFRHNRCVERAASARQDRGRTRDEPRVPERQPEPLQEPVGRPEDGGGQHEPRRHPDRGRRDRGSRMPGRGERPRREQRRRRQGDVAEGREAAVDEIEGGRHVEREACDAERGEASHGRRDPGRPRHRRPQGGGVDAHAHAEGHEARGHEGPRRRPHGGELADGVLDRRVARPQRAAGQPRRHEGDGPCHTAPGRAHPAHLGLHHGVALSCPGDRAPVHNTRRLDARTTTRDRTTGARGGRARTGAERSRRDLPHLGARQPSRRAGWRGGRRGSPGGCVRPARRGRCAPSPGASATGRARRPPRRAGSGCR